MAFRDQVSSRVGTRVKMGDPEPETDNAVAVAEVPVEQEDVTYFHWAGQDSKGRAMPSGEIIHISGGEKRISADGQAIIMPETFVQFHNGMITTSDPRIVAFLDKKCQDGGNCITKDREEYYAHTMTAEQRLRREGVLAVKKDEEIAEQKREISRLKEQLERAGGKPEAA